MPQVSIHRTSKWSCGFGWTGVHRRQWVWICTASRPVLWAVKNAKIVLCYANPSRDSKTSEVINSSDHLNQLFEQLDGLQPYPHKIPGWDSWFRPVANSLFDGDVIAASNNISVFNLVPYASTNMDRVQTFANCLPSVWAAQDYLRNTLIPKALQGDILLVMCRSSQLWGLRTPFGSEKTLWLIEVLESASQKKQKKQ